MSTSEAAEEAMAAYGAYLNNEHFLYYNGYQPEPGYTNHKRTCLECIVNWAVSGVYDEEAEKCWLCGNYGHIGHYDEFCPHKVKNGSRGPCHSCVPPTFED